MARHKCRYHMEWKSVIRMGNESNKVYKSIYKNFYRHPIDVSLGSLHVCCSFCMHTHALARARARTHTHACMHARTHAHACPHTHTNENAWHKHAQRSMMTMRLFRTCSGCAGRGRRTGSACICTARCNVLRPPEYPSGSPELPSDHLAPLPFQWLNPVRRPRPMSTRHWLRDWDRTLPSAYRLRCYCVAQSH